MKNIFKSIQSYFSSTAYEDTVKNEIVEKVTIPTPKVTEESYCHIKGQTGAGIYVNKNNEGWKYRGIISSEYGVWVDLDDGEVVEEGRLMNYQVRLGDGKGNISETVTIDLEKL